MWQRSTEMMEHITLYCSSTQELIRNYYLHFLQKHSGCSDSFCLKWLLSDQSDFILLITVNIVLWFVQYAIVSPPIFLKYFRIWCVSFFMLICCDFLFYLLIYDQIKIINWLTGLWVVISFWGCGVSWSSSFCVVWADKSQSLFVSMLYCIYGPRIITGAGSCFFLVFDWHFKAKLSQIGSLFQELLVCCHLCSSILCWSITWIKIRLVESLYLCLHFALGFFFLSLSQFLALDDHLDKSLYFSWQYFQL